MLDSDLILKDLLWVRWSSILWGTAVRKPAALSFISEHFATLMGEAVSLGPAQHCQACYDAVSYRDRKELCLSFYHLGSLSGGTSRSLSLPLEVFPSYWSPVCQGGMVIIVSSSSGDGSTSAFYPSCLSALPGELKKIQLSKLYFPSAVSDVQVELGATGLNGSRWSARHLLVPGPVLASSPHLSLPQSSPVPAFQCIQATLRRRHTLQ